MSFDYKSFMNDLDEILEIEYYCNKCKSIFRNTNQIKKHYEKTGHKHYGKKLKEIIDKDV